MDQPVAPFQHLINNNNNKLKISIALFPDVIKSALQNPIKR